jgi:hypothetical protein
MKRQLMLCTLLLTSSAVLFAGTAQAEITDKTRCSEFVATSNVYDKAISTGKAKLFNETEEGRKLQEYYLFMGNTMDGLDIDHIQAGKPGIMASLSDDGRQNLVAAAAVQCRNHQNMTIWNAAAYVYRGIRDMEMELGAAK